MKPNQWKEAIEISLIDPNSCGFCIMTERMGDSWYRDCSICVLNFTGHPPGCVDWCHNSAYIGIDHAGDWYAPRLTTSRKRFWTEFALSNPELGVDHGY